MVGNKRNVCNWITYLLVGLYGVSCMYLYYMQSVQPMVAEERIYESDLPFHISMIIDDGWYYSFTAYAYQLLYSLAGGSTVLIAAFLALVSVGTVFVTEKLLRVLKVGSVNTLAMALVLNFVMPFYVPFVGQYRYVSYQSGNLWHNSTYLCMRLVAIVCMILYLEMAQAYKEKINWKKWLWFAVALVICTGIKPSFLTVFAPAMAIKLLFDLVKRVPFRNIFLFGCSVLPACGVVLWQNAVLFGEDTGQGFTVSPWATFSLHANVPKLAVVCSVLFPLFVTLFLIKELFKDTNFLFAWSMAGVGFLEALLLVETGSRSRDGNFLWGYCFAIFYLYVLCLTKWQEILGCFKKASLYKKIGVVICGVVLVYQLYCGCEFYIRLLFGETYFMMR